MEEHKQLKFEHNSSSLMLILQRNMKSCILPLGIHLKVLDSNLFFSQCSLFSQPPLLAACGTTLSCCKQHICVFYFYQKSCSWPCELWWKSRCSWECKLHMYDCKIFIPQWQKHADPGVAEESHAPFSEGVTQLRKTYHLYDKCGCWCPFVHVTWVLRFIAPWIEKRTENRWCWWSWRA